MWHEWTPKDGAVPMEIAEQNIDGPVVILANDNCIFLPMNEKDIKHYFYSNGQARIKDIISRIGLNLKHFRENDCDYIEDRKLSEDEDEVPMKKSKVTKKRGRRSKFEAKEDYKCGSCPATFGSRRQLKDHRLAIQ